MPISDKLASYVRGVQDNFSLLNKWIEVVDSILDVELIESHITFIKDILDIVGLSGGLVYRKDDGLNRRDSFNRRNSMGKREDIIKSYARTLSTVLHQCSAKLAKIEQSLNAPDITPVEAKKLEKLIISLKLYFETGLPPVNLMIPISQKRRKSLNAPIDRQLKINNMRRKGMLLMDKSKIFSSVKPRWIILDDKKLHIFKDEQATTAYKELPLENILNISSAKLGKHEFGFNVSCLVEQCCISQRQIKHKWQVGCFP